MLRPLPKFNVPNKIRTFIIDFDKTIDPTLAKVEGNLNNSQLELLILFILKCSTTLLFLLSTLSLPLKAQPAAEVFGGRAAGMANITSTTRDAWGTFHNPASLNGIENAIVALSYTNRYQIEAFQSIAALGAWEMPIATFGVGISRFGDNLFSQQRFVLNAAKSLSGVDIGIRLGYTQLMMQGLETRGMPFIDFGVITQLTSTLWLGASLHHINQPEVSPFEDERLPALMRAGLRFQPVKRFNTFLEVEKENTQPTTLRFGAEYEWFNLFFVRTGVSTQPTKAFFGLGGSWKNLTLDYALQSHTRLGLTHQLSVAYQLPKKLAASSNDE